VSVNIRPAFREEKRPELTLAEPMLVTLTTPERLLAAVRRRWWVLTLALVAGSGGGTVAGFLLPAWYESSVSFAVLPTDDPTAPVPMDANMTALPLFTHIVSSRRVADQVVAQLQLTRAFGKETPQDARVELLKHVTVWSDRKSNVVSLSVEDRVPARAKSIAQAFGEVGRMVNNEIWSAKTSDARKRLEARMTEYSTQLAAAEAEMRAFRERERVVDLPEQIRASVSEASFLERMKNERKVSLHFNQGFAGADSPEVRRSQLEAGSAQAALQGLVHGNSRGPLLALDNVPRLEQEHARLKRQIDTHSSLYDVLVRQVEQLRAAETRPGGRAELLDTPSEPRKPVRPSRVVLLIQGLFFGLLIGLVLVVWPRRLVRRAWSEDSKGAW
jgi:uncharacterized protein involved in exopolysaccharide biosynthesis